jgi:hypothetical protein
MLGILEDYIKYLKSTKNQSLLARIYGIYTLKTNYFLELNVIVMQNTVGVVNKKNAKMVFDLKGS